MLDNDFIRARMSLLQLSAAQLAALVGIVPNRLSLWLNGAKDLPATEVLRVRQTLTDLEELTRYAAPFEISWRNVGQTRKLMESMQNGTLKSQLLEKVQTL